MPRDRRRESDTRPAFARPPNAPTDSSPTTSPQRSKPRHRSRSHSQNPTSLYSSDAYIDESSLPQTPTKSHQPRQSRTRTTSKAKASPLPSPEKEQRRPRHTREHSHTHGAGHVRSRESRDRDVEVRRQHKRKISEPVKQSPRAERELDRARDRAKYNSGTSQGSTSQLLSADSLAKLNQKNLVSEEEERRADRKREKKERQKKELKTEVKGEKRRRDGRQVSGAILEEGRGQRTRRATGGAYGYDDEDESWEEKRYTRKSTGDGGGGGGGRGGNGFLGWKSWSRRRKLFIFLGFMAVLLIIIIAAAVVANKNKSGGKSGGGSSSSGSSPKNSCDASSVPAEAKGTYTDVSTWLDTTDFNCTYTSETVGGLSIMGLKSSWDDSTQANANVPALNEQWQYGKMPIRGTNIGGWLNLEPFITPSLFQYAASDNVVDEYTLSQKLGNAASRMLENHYATYITKQDFADIANAGLDHVRIPYPYWAVRTYDGDPYVAQISWRYLLRAIEWARQYGIRVNLDLHSAPGSQNGWAHSGHQGSINWLMGANGATNGQRTLDIHDQLSKFFAQDRYKNVVTIYGLVNEPKMLVLDHNTVLDWNKKAISLIRGNGIKQWLVFGDGFLALDDWDNMFKGVDNKLIMDTHQYQIFNVGQLKLKHQDKINLACSGWSGMLVAVNNPTTGWGPTMNGEWSQADTDCTPYLNNVGVGSRWAGTLNMGDSGVSVTTQTCASPPCSCDMANADPSRYPDAYKRFLKMFAEAQMHAFEQAWGWFYWTWKTENAVQWSWKLGLKAGILPAKAYQPSFKCDSAVPSFSDLSESY